MREWLHANPEDRKGARGATVKSNRTDNESAKMATDKGVIQGYCGVAAVDAQHQVIVQAQAHGTGNEQALLWPVIEALQPVIGATQTLITADAGYHCETNLVALDGLGVDALIADHGMRRRDERFADHNRHKQQPDPLHHKGSTKKKTSHFGAADFTHDPVAGTCICPAGEQLYSNGTNCTFNGYPAVKCRGAQRDCVPCLLRDQCLRKPETTRTRQVAFFKNTSIKNPHTARMRQRIDTAEGRAAYGRRFATVEPVFANLRHNKRLSRFTLRGRVKVDAQWKLFCLVHNIEKLAHHGYGQ